MANTCNFYTFYACPNSRCIYLQCVGKCFLLLSWLALEIFPPKDVSKCLIITVQQASPQWHILTHLENDSSSWLSRKSFPSLINFVEEMAILFFSIEKQGRRRDLETNPTKVLVCHISSDRLLWSTVTKVHWTLFFYHTKIFFEANSSIMVDLEMAIKIHLQIQQKFLCVLSAVIDLCN